MPQSVAIDAATDTIYVANGTGTTSVVNGALCNATVTRGCGNAIASIDVEEAAQPSTRSQEL